MTDTAPEPPLVGDPLLAAAAALLADERPSELRAAYGELSERYRSASPTRASAVGATASVAAYLAARLPATSAATQRVFEDLARVRPGFSPRSLLDLGCGPGGASWAAVRTFGSIASCVLVERRPEMARVAGALASRAPDVAVREATVTLGDATRPEVGADLVVAAYLLGELAAGERRPAVERWWEATGDCLVLVEAGTPGGSATLLEARDALLVCGASVLAPCPHELACPLVAGDWCHFAARVARSSLHRVVKGAERGFEDEKYAYLVVSRTAVGPAARVLRRPVERSGYVRLTLCEPDGTVDEVVSSRRDGARFVAARALRWGDRVAAADRTGPETTAN